MKKDEPPLTKREALALMKAELGFEASADQILSVAAYGLRWRNRRLAELERQVVQHGGWPWKVRNRKRKRA